MILPSKVVGEKCRYCKTEIVYPYWRCVVCKKFVFCHECFLDMHPGLPEQDNHFREHELKLIRHAKAPHALHNDEKEEKVEEEAVEEPQVGTVEAPPADVPEERMEIDSDEDTTTPADKANVSADVSTDASTSSEDDIVIII